MAPDENSKGYLTYYGADPNKVTLFPYASIYKHEILATPYEPKSIAKLRSKLGIEGERVFVSTGFFIKRKNFEALIRLWSDMPNTYHLYLIGEGKLKKRYLRIIKHLKLSNVHILPYMAHEALSSLLTKIFMVTSSPKPCRKDYLYIHPRTSMRPKP